MRDGVAAAHVAPAVELEHDIRAVVAGATNVVGAKLEVGEENHLIEQVLLVVAVQGDGLAVAVDAGRAIELIECNGAGPATVSVPSPLSPDDVTGVTPVTLHDSHASSVSRSDAQRANHAGKSPRTSPQPLSSSASHSARYGPSNADVASSSNSSRSRSQSKTRCRD